MNRKLIEGIFNGLILAVATCMAVVVLVGPKYVIMAVGIGVIISICRVAWKRGRLLELLSTSIGITGTIALIMEGFAYQLRHPHLTSMQVFILNWPWLIGGIVAVIFGYWMREWQDRKYRKEEKD